MFVGFNNVVTTCVAGDLARGTPSRSADRRPFLVPLVDLSL
jgi:hypothetical protein